MTVAANNEVCSLDVIVINVKHYFRKESYATQKQNPQPKGDSRNWVFVLRWSFLERPKEQTPGHFFVPSLRRAK